MKNEKLVGKSLHDSKKAIINLYTLIWCHQHKAITNVCPFIWTDPPQESSLLILLPQTLPPPHVDPPPMDTESKSPATPSHPLFHTMGTLTSQGPNNLRDRLHSRPCDPLPPSFLDELFDEFIGANLWEDGFPARTLRSMMASLMKLSHSTTTGELRTTDEILELQQFVLDNITSPAYLSQTDVHSLVLASRLPNLKDLKWDLRNADCSGRDFGQILQSMPNLTHLAFKAEKVDLAAPTVFDTIQQPFSLPQLEDLTIPQLFLTKTTLEILCMYASFAQLRSFCSCLQYMLAHSPHRPRQKNSDSAFYYDDIMMMGWFKQSTKIELLSWLIDSGSSLSQPLLDYYFANLEEFLPREDRLWLDICEHNTQSGNKLLSAVLQSPYLRNLSYVAVTNYDFGDPEAGFVMKLIGLLASNPSLTNTTHLTLSGFELTPALANIIAGSPYLNNITSMLLRSCEFTGDSFRILFHSPKMSQLQSLTLDSSDSNEHLIILSASPYLGNLETIVDGSTGSNQQGFAHLINSPVFAKLTSLRGLHFFGDDEAAAISFFQSPSLSRLTTLRFSRCTLTPGLQLALAQCQHLTNVVDLRLPPGTFGSTNRSSSPSIAELFFSNPAFSNLTNLNLYDCLLSDNDLKHLAQSPSLYNLNDLNIGKNEGITGVGIDHLIASSSLPNLKALRLARVSFISNARSLRNLFQAPYLYANNATIFLSDVPSISQLTLLAKRPWVCRLDFTEYGH